MVSGLSPGSSVLKISGIGFAAFKVLVLVLALWIWLLRIWVWDGLGLVEAQAT